MVWFKSSLDLGRKFLFTIKNMLQRLFKIKDELVNQRKYILLTEFSHRALIIDIYTLKNVDKNVIIY